MIKKLLIALVAVALATPAFATVVVPKPVPGPLFSRTAPVGPYIVFGCASGIIAAAIAKNAQGYGELTQAEAATCGALYWANAASGRLTYVAHKVICTQPERCY